MTLLTEGRLRFGFPNWWIAIKYDATDFYTRHLASNSFDLKGVDIVAFTAREQSHLLLLEVKDFRGYGVENRQRQTSGELLTEVLQKFAHTVSGLFMAGHAAAPSLLAIAERLFPYPQKIELVLFMEDDVPPNESRIAQDNRRKRRTDLELKLKAKLTPLRIKSRILDRHGLKPRDRWAATDAPNQTN